MAASEDIHCIIASGYVRQESKNIKFFLNMVIPLEIIRIIYEYSKIAEKWFVAGQYTKIDDDLVEFTKSSIGWNSAYGTIEISKGIHEWRVKIEITGAGIALGIATQTSKKDTHFHDRPNSPFKYFSYGCGHDGNKGIYCDPIKQYDANIRLNDHDIITLLVDLNEGYLTMTKNNGELLKKIKIENNLSENIKYRLTASNWNNAKLRILSYSKIK